MDKVEIKGIVESVTYRNKENGYTVVNVNGKNESFVATGIMPFLSEGDAVTLHGSYVYHSAYGQQFKADVCEVDAPKTQAQILRYLSSGAIKGIGPATANKIVSLFKDDTLDIIENSPLRLTAIKGVSSEKAFSISEQFKMQFGIRDIMLTLSRFKISPDEAAKIFKALGANSLKTIKNNPYVLCREPIGFSFERVDEIAESYDVKVDSDYRIAAGIEYVLKSNLSNGHTCLPLDKLTRVAANFLLNEESKIREIIDSMVDSLQLYEYSFDGVDFIYLPEYASAEEYIAGRIRNFSKNNTSLYDITELELRMLQNRLNIVFDADQIDAVNEAMRNSLFVLTGGPGTGKTTTLNAIIRIFDERNMSIALAAPTGRAAKRMTELTGKDAATLHRLLEVEWHGDSKPYFAKNSRNPLDYDVIIIDEMSMVDVQLFKAFLEATRPTARIILVGDSEQLPSVGAGNILNDIISSNEVSFVRLNKIFRQSNDSSIVSFAHNIINGLVPEEYERAGDFFFMRRGDMDSVVSTVTELVTERLPKAYGFSVNNDIQVLCPSRKKDSGSANLNNVLQQAINPLKRGDSELNFKGVAFRIGDKVMHIKNDYDIIWENDKGENGCGVFNGDIGYIESIDARNRLIRVRYENKVASYYEENLGLLELAYAITVHKSQGCEFDCVVIPLFDTTPLLRYRNLLYTAITRAKKMIVLVGDPSIFEDMIRNDRKTLRYTGLKYFLTEERL